MVDFQTQYRQYGYRYNAPTTTQPVSNYRDLYREREMHLFRTPRVQVHDCRLPVTEDFTDDHLWEAHILSHGLDATYRSVNQLHSKPRQEDEHGIKPPDKLLYMVGGTGSGKAQFRFPRGLAVDISGDILVADTMNHRVQRLNRSGVFKSTFGKKGSGPGQFNEPVALTVTFSGDIIVADKNNRRIQVFGEEDTFMFEIKTKEYPFSCACDEDDKIVVGSTVGTVEIYNRDGKFLKQFSTRNNGSKGTFIYAACNNREEVVVSDPKSRKIKTFSYDGKLLHQFEPKCNGEGLAFDPAGVCVNPLGQILVCDKLNHTINFYTDKGILLEQVVGPTDEAGGLVTCAIGPEGHLVVTELSANQDHCVKIFRYRDCDCHRKTPASSRSRFTSAAPSPSKASVVTSSQAVDGST